MKIFRIIIAILFPSLIVFSCSGTKQDNEDVHQVLPVLGPKKLGSQQGDTLYHTIENFTLTNQFGEVVSNQSVEGKIYVADFFFATCQSICPMMSSQMARVQSAFLNDSSVVILSHTVNPSHDTVEVLKAYGEKYGTVKGKWHLLTGSKKEIYDLAKKSYLVNALEDDGTPEGFIHSEGFLLIDKKRRLRGIYDGTDSLQIEKLIADIKLLKTEKEWEKSKLND